MLVDAFEIQHQLWLLPCDVTKWCHLTFKRKQWQLHCDLMLVCLFQPNEKAEPFRWGNMESLPRRNFGPLRATYHLAIEAKSPLPARAVACWQPVPIFCSLQLYLLYFRKRLWRSNSKRQIEGFMFFIPLAFESVRKLSCSVDDENSVWRQNICSHHHPGISVAGLSKLWMRLLVQKRRWTETAVILPVVTIITFY